MREASFADTAEQALRGKHVRVHSDVGIFEGWVDRIAPDRGSIILYDATNTTTEESIGSIFLRTCEAVEVLRPAKRIEFCATTDLTPYPEYDTGERPAAELVRRACRNQSPGEFPLVRESGTVLNGYEYVAAADVAGLEHIPVEMIDVSDTQAAELFRLGDDSERAAPSEDGDSQSDADQPSTASNDTKSNTDDEDSAVYGYGD
jgi:hypothetical protein